MRLLKFDLSKKQFGIGIAVILLLGWAFMHFTKSLDIKNKTGDSWAGVVKNCENYKTRPLAVMLSSDEEARPLSGIAQADIVVEIPVSVDGITRMMAIFECEKPVEIGSIRSARADFIPLVAGFGALYAHWGGEKDALTELKNHVLDNIDGLVDPAFYRKNGIEQPHNGFTSYEKLMEAAERLGYSTVNNSSGQIIEKSVQIREGLSEKQAGENTEIKIPYRSPYDIVWKYDQNVDRYRRIRGGTEEKDKGTNESVYADNIIILKTDSKFLREQYIRVRTTGTGSAEIYNNGHLTRGTWQKYSDSLSLILTITDSSGKEIELMPGKTWIEVIVS